MDTLSYKTQSENKNTVDKQWVIVDAEGQTLGRFASRVATLLRGKHKPGFTPHVDCGDNVIVINAAKVRLTGNKWDAKEYIWHTGYPGGQKRMSATDMVKRRPRFLVEAAVKGMLPHTRLGRQMFRNLYVYEGTEHPHEGQQPTELELK